MKINLYRAQALDNESSDPCEWHGVALKAEASTDRQIAQSYASKISLKGKNIYSEEWVELFKYKNTFLLELPCVEKDIAGRIATVICCGEISHPVSDDEITFIVKGLESFAHRIGRKIDNEAMHRGITSLTYLTKKNKQTINKLSVYILTLITLTLAYLLLNYH